MFVNKLFTYLTFTFFKIKGVLLWNLHYIILT